MICGACGKDLPHTNNVRYRDYILCVIADKRWPPFAKGSSLGMKAIEHWDLEDARNLNNPFHCRAKLI